MRRIVSVVLGIAALAPCGLNTGSSPAAQPGTDVLRLGAYSVVKEAVHDGLLPASAAEWKRRTGREIRFEESCNGSGAQARSVVAGLDVDIAVRSHSGDTEALVAAGRVKRLS
jgi:ABC-type sulfate transport system substrate-binding protein